jgi:hypothetical protein
MKSLSTKRSMSRAALLAVVLSLGIAVGDSERRPVHAYVINDCPAGLPIIWRKTVRLYRSTCEGLSDGDKNASYWNAVNQWNRRKTLFHEFWQTNACNPTSNNGMNEVALRSMGSNGSTLVSIQGCDIVEADIRVRRDMRFAEPVPTDFDEHGRVTFMHEFGHFLGFRHQEAFSIMREFAPRPLTGDIGQHVTIWTDDTTGIFDKMGGFNQNHANFQPSAFRMTNASGGMWLADEGTINRRCGDSVTVRFRVDNTGNLGHGWWREHVRLSTTSPQDGGFRGGGRIPAIWDSHWTGGFFSTDELYTFTIDNDLAPGLYYIYHAVDTLSEWPELDDSDNATVSGRTVNITPC